MRVGKLFTSSLCSVPLMALLLAAPAAHAADCIEEAAGRKLTCSSNDVRIAQARAVNITNDCQDGDGVATFDLVADVTPGPDRYDIGIYTATSGDARTGECNVTTLQSGSDLDGDACLDVTDPVTDQPAGHFENVPCTDSDGDGNLDIPSCLSWDNRDRDDCESAADAVPSSPSKCRCEDVNVDNIPVPPAGCDDVVCPDDGDVCNGPEHCELDANGNGFCTSGPDATVGTPCEDGDGCTSDSGTVGDPDACDGNGQCVGQAVICADDGEVCNGPEHCEATAGVGACVSGPNAGTTTPCEDGDKCTSADGAEHGTEFCDGNGNCTPGQLVTCDASSGNCTVGQCNPADGECTGVNAPPGTGCSDGSLCTTGDVCDANGGCIGTEVDCSGLDGDCVVGRCLGGSCTTESANEGGSCDDNDECTEGDVCVSGTCTGAPVNDDTSEASGFGVTAALAGTTIVPPTPSASGNDSAEVLIVPVPGVGFVRVLGVDTSLDNPSTPGVIEATAVSEAAKVDLLPAVNVLGIPLPGGNNLVEVRGITAVASCNTDTGCSNEGSRIARATLAGTNIVDLTDPIEVPLNPLVNVKLLETIDNGNEMTVNGLHVIVLEIPGGAPLIEVIVSQAHAGVSGGTCEAGE